MPVIGPDMAEIGAEVTLAKGALMRERSTP